MTRHNVFTSRDFLHECLKDINILLCQRFFRQDLKRCKTLTAACKENLSLMVRRFQQQKNEYLEILKVGGHFNRDLTILRLDCDFDLL